MVALMMTGKRTLFIIPIAVLLIYVILFSKNNKFIKLAGVGLGITIFIIGAYVLVPGASLIINRIVNSEGDVLSGREVFWNYAMEMFRQSPLFGKGFLSFNDYAFYRGFRYYGERWNYQAHNVYIQLLAETGIVGFLLMTLLIILMLFKTISAVKEKPVFWNILLIYWIILFGVYSFTGNTLYYPYQGYNNLPDIKRCSCWAHVRRYFTDAIPKGKEYDYSLPAVQGVQFCCKLFDCERYSKAKNHTAEQRKQFRLEKEKPILEAFWNWLDQQCPNKGTRLAKAVNYAQNRKDTLMTYM